MRSVMSITGGIFILIMIYLLVRNGDQTIGVINALSYPAIQSIKTLQGR